MEIFSTHGLAIYKTGHIAMWDGLVYVCSSLQCLSDYASGWAGISCSWAKYFNQLRKIILLDVLYHMIIITSNTYVQIHYFIITYYHFPHFPQIVKIYCPKGNSYFLVYCINYVYIIDLLLMCSGINDNCNIYWSIWFID